MARTWLLKLYVIVAVNIVHTLVLQAQQKQKAFVCVPVADLTPQPAHHLFPGLAAYQAHTHIPFSSTKKSQTVEQACARHHQLLFNEIVTIIDRVGDEVLVETESAYYVTQQNNQKQNRYWTCACNLIPLTALHPNTLKRLPPTISYQNPRSAYPQPGIITLAQPFSDPITGMTFSAGTRFVRALQKNAIKKSSLLSKEYTVFALDAHKKKWHVISIPVTYAAPYDFKNASEQQAYFVQLVREWARQPHYIPYALGGISIGNRYENNQFAFITKQITPQLEVGFFERARLNQGAIYGIDCSGLVARAALIAGLPYFFKNTYTLAQELRTIARGEQLEEGDLIYFRGHVMIIADIARNTLIEARSYDHGYGIVHEIELNKVFKDMATYHDLVHAHLQGKTLERLDSKGVVADRFSSWQLLKLKSVWEKPHA